jgi:hypothetical protein
MTTGPLQLLAAGAAGGAVSLHVVGVGNANLWHTIRRRDRSWQSSFGVIEDEVSGGPPAFTSFGCVGGVQGTLDSLQVVGGGDGNLWHTIRNEDGSWQPSFGRIEDQVMGGPSRDQGQPGFTAVGCANDGENMHVVGVGDGQLWHTIRNNADGSWQSPFGLIGDQVSGGPRALLPWAAEPTSSPRSHLCMWSE